MDYGFYTITQACEDSTACVLGEDDTVQSISNEFTLNVSKKGMVHYKVDRFTKQAVGQVIKLPKTQGANLVEIGCAEVASDPDADGGESA